MTASTQTERTMMLAEMHTDSARDMTLDGRADDALVQWLKAIALYEELGAREHEQDAVLEAAKLAERTGHHQRAFDLFQRAVELARVPGSEGELGTALAHLSRVAIASGHLAEGIAHAHEAMAIGDQIDEPRLVASTGLTIAQLELGRGELDAAEENLERTQRAFEAAGDESGVGHAHNLRGEILRAQGDLPAAAAAFEVALKTFMGKGDVRGLALAMANQGNIARMSGDLDGAESLFQGSYELAVGVGDVPAVARALTNLGNIAAARGELAKARADYEKALVYDRKHGQTKAVIGGLVNLASLAATQGRLADAHAAYLEAFDALRPLRSARTSADVLAMVGQLDARMGRLAEAERHFAEARVLAQQAAHTLALARLDISDAAMIYARGDVTRALAAYRAAAPRLEAVGGAGDMATLWLVIADASLMARDLDGAQAALDAAASRLSAGDAREQLDIAITRARVALASDLGAADDLRTIAEQLDSAGRPIDALTARLAALEIGPTPDDAPMATALKEAAERLALAPLLIEAQSAWLAASGGDPNAVEALVAEAEALELGLLALRTRRRWAATLFRAGQDEAARRVRDDAIARAHRSGALLEAERLEALA